MKRSHVSVVILCAIFAVCFACAAPQHAPEAKVTQGEASVPAWRPDIELTTAPETLPTRDRICDGFDGLVRITPRPCIEYGFNEHTGPVPPGVIVVGAPTAREPPPPSRVCVNGIGAIFGVPPGHQCSMYASQVATASQREMAASTESGGGYSGGGSGGSGGSVYVRGYTRSNGTYVHGYTRSSPGRR